MDPNATLANLRRLSAALLRDVDSGYADYDNMLEMAEAFNALDLWFSRGGFKPDEWKTLPYDFPATTKREEDSR